MASLAFPSSPTSPIFASSANPLSVFGPSSSLSSHTQREAHNLYSDLYRAIVAKPGELVPQPRNANNAPFGTLRSKKSMPSFAMGSGRTTSSGVFSEKYPGSVRVVLKESSNVAKVSDFGEFGVLHTTTLKPSPSSPHLPLSTSSPTTPTSASKRFFGRVLGLKKAERS